MSDYLKIDLTKSNETFKGCWMQPDGGKEEFVPYSLMGKLSDRKAEGAGDGDTVTVFLPDWFIDKKDWEDYCYE